MVFSGNINSPYNSRSDHCTLDQDPSIVFTTAPPAPDPSHMSAARNLQHYIFL